MSFLANNTKKPNSEAVKSPEIDQNTPETTVLEVNKPTIPQIPKEEKTNVNTDKIPQNTPDAIGDNSQSASNYFTTPREKKQDAPPKEEKAQEQQQEEPTPEDEPVNSMGLTKEECFSVGEFIAESGDIAIPQLAAYLNEEDDATQYEAGEKKLKHIAKAWGRYLWDKQITLSPFQEVLLSTAMAYAIPLAGGIKHRFPPIAKKIKRFFTGGSKEAEPNKVYKAKPVKPQTKKDFKLNFEEVEEIEEVEVLESEKTVEKPCKNEKCNNYFEQGQGFAKGKNSVNFDKFCSKPCMYQYTGSQSKGNKKKGK